MVDNRLDGGCKSISNNFIIGVSSVEAGIAVNRVIVLIVRSSVHIQCKRRIKLYIDANVKTRVHFNSASNGNKQFVYSKSYRCPIAINRCFECGMHCIFVYFRFTSFSLNRKECIKQRSSEYLLAYHFTPLSSCIDSSMQL